MKKTLFSDFFNILEKSLKLYNWHNKGWTRQFERENGADKIMTEVPLIRGSGAGWERTQRWDSKQTNVHAILLVQTNIRTFVLEILGDISTYRCNIIRVVCHFALSDSYPLIDVVETWMMWPWQLKAQLLLHFYVEILVNGPVFKAVLIEILMLMFGWQGFYIGIVWYL